MPDLGRVDSPNSAKAELGAKHGGGGARAQVGRSRLVRDPYFPSASLSAQFGGRSFESLSVSLLQVWADEPDLELLAARGGVVSASKMANEAKILVIGFPFN